MAKKTFAVKDRVALAENPSYRGVITIVHPGVQTYSGDRDTYNVRWDKSGEYLYLAEALITEKFAIEQVEKETAEKKTLADKFASIEAETKEETK